MKLLFVQGGTRVKQDQNGNWYSDTNFHNAIWKRYRSYCDEFTILLRREENVYSPTEAQSRFNPIDSTVVTLVTVPDLYRPIQNYLRLSMRNEIKNIIEEAVKKADKVIVRSVNNFYTITTLEYAIQYKKPYLIEVAGACWEGFWYHSLRGKMVAYKREYDCKKYLSKAPYAVYVTEDALQKRYPCSGITLGCSDVELQELNQTDLNDRIKRIDNMDDKKCIVIGTAAALDVKWKGQETVIRALKKLKDMGITNIQYKLIGAGKKDYLQKIVNKYGLNDNVEIIGTLPHNQVSSWLKSLDVYVQPSYQEGLCRSIVEALSVACPVICTNVGGNYELVPKEYLYEKGNINQLVEMLKQISDKDFLRISAVKGFERAKDFEKELLDEKRNRFYQEFCKAQ